MATEVKPVLCHSSHERCGLLATIVDGKLTKLEGNPNAINNGGRVCERIKYIPEWHDHEKRINYPLKRVGPRGAGQWEQITWDQACTEIAEKLHEIVAEYGEESVVLQRGTGRTDEWYAALFFNLLGSPNVNVGACDICWCPTMTADAMIYGNFASPSAGPESEVMLTWGKNLMESGDFPETWQQLDALALGKAKLIVIDPRCIDFARKADLWLQLRPGTDGAMALGFLNVIITEELYDKEFVEKWCYGFDELVERVKDYTPEKVAQITWVHPEKIRAAARMWGKARPGACGWGLATDTIGRNATNANRLKGFLRAICGNMNVSGGCALVAPHYMRFRHTNDLGRPDLLPKSKRHTCGQDTFPIHTWASYELISEAQSRVYHRDYASVYNYNCSAPSAISYNAMITGKPQVIKASFIQAGNPFSMVADTKQTYQALKALELIVTHEYFMTPAAALSDYVLPGATWLERPLCFPYALWGCADVDWWGYRAVDPMYERRDNYGFWKAIAEKFFPEDIVKEYWHWKDKEEVALWIMEPLGYKTFDECVERPYLHPPVPKWHEDLDPETGQQYGFATPTGKVEIHSTIMEKLCGPESAVPDYEEPFESPVKTPELAKEYPLIMIAGSRFMPMYHSEYRQIEGFRARCRDPHFEIHFETAANLGIADGDWCWIETKRGKFLQRAKLSSGILPRAIAAQHGWWYPELPMEEPWLGGWFMSNTNMATDKAPENCDPYAGGFNIKQGLCKVYKASQYPFNTVFSS